VAAACALVVTKDNVATVFQFHGWAEQYGKEYKTTQDYDHAFNNFRASLKRVQHRQAECKKRNCPTVWGLTKFSDLSPKEFKQQYLTATPTPSKHHHVATVKHAHNAPSTWDWRSKGVVTPVKDQGQCGSCWAFSTTENVESMWALYTKQKPPILAPQQLVDCDPQSQGCGGGWTYWAFEYLMNAGGQELEHNYPYRAVNQPCQFNPAKIAAKVQNYTFAITPCEQGSCPSQDEQKLRAGLSTIGPFSVCVNAASWSDYQGGVIEGSSCDGGAQTLDHCVQLVGYDMTADTPYYIVRNSWNTNWGDAGYIYLQTDSNTCGVADVVTFGNEHK
jgi:C1A family cysteine protease